jgi:ribonuclease J
MKQRQNLRFCLRYLDLMVGITSRALKASEYASYEDITWVIDQIDPDHIVPIHTEARGWFSESFDNVFLPVDGDQW